MVDTKKNSILRIVVMITLLLLPAPVIQAEENQHITLRSSCKDLIVLQVLTVPNIFIVNKHNYGFYGHSTINNDYETKSINGDLVVIDHTTDLIWLQSGSENGMDWHKAKKWVKSLNEKGYAGYSDWRLPTVEEAISLLEKSRNIHGMYIDPVFDSQQTGLWTGDTNNGTSYLDGAWCVRFAGGYGGGNICWVYDTASNYVRPVRSADYIR